VYQRPKLRAHLRFHAESAERAYLLGEDGAVVLRGQVYARLLPLLDGCHSLSEIFSAVGCEATLVWLALGRLDARGALCEGGVGPPAAIAAFASTLGVDPGRAASLLESRSVFVRGVGRAHADRLKDLLVESGLRWTSVEAQAALVVALADDYLHPELSNINRRALERPQPWMLARVDTASPWIGPLFSPGTTGCHACLANRLRRNFPLDADLLERTAPDGAGLPAASSLPAMTEAGLALVVAEVARWVLLAPEAGRPWPAQASARIGTLGQVIVLSQATIGLDRHPLTRRPQCPTCGERPSGTVVPVRLDRQPKRFTADGGHRSAVPDETIERLGRHVSPITGVIQAIYRRGPAGSPIHAYSTWPHTWVGRRASGAVVVQRSGASGKGKGDRQALASALGECLEHYSAEFSGDEPRVRARADELDGAVLPSRLLHFSDAQYRNRERWNREHPEHEFRIPEPFDPDAAIDWTPAWSLTGDEVRHLPTAFCYFDYPFGDQPRFCWPDSNGNAAGNNREEAILQGFLELVERDAVAIWWFNRVRRPGVDLASFGEPYLIELDEFYRSRRRDLWTIDLTGDLGIPVFAVLLRCLDGPAEKIVMGFGAHLDPRLALLRAATEANQMAIARGVLRDSAVATDTACVDAWLRDATAAGHPYLLPDPDLPVSRAGSFGDLRCEDLAGEVSLCVEIAARHGLDVLVLDQTRPDVGLSAVKVVVPGLRHFWPRFGPGRLYDTPVSLGWLTRARHESELNPVVTIL
jgi:oxazoline/thiazoline synthase